MITRWRALTIFGVVLFGVLIFLPSYTETESYYQQASTPTSIPPTATQEPVSVEPRVIELERRVEYLELLAEMQSDVYEATVQRMEFYLTLISIAVALIPLLASFLSFFLFRKWVISQVEKELKEITAQEISHLIGNQVDQLRKAWEPKFVELYKEYRRLVREHR